MSPVYDLDYSDYSEDGFALPPEGEHMAEVVSVEGRLSKNGGHPQLNVRFCPVGKRNQTLCFDTLTLGGGGKNMALTKLEQLGVARGTPQLDTSSLIGRRVALSIMHETYDGKTRAKVDIRAPGFRAGYRAEAPAPADTETTPF